MTRTVLHPKLRPAAITERVDSPRQVERAPICRTRGHGFRSSCRSTLGSRMTVRGVLADRFHASDFVPALAAGAGAVVAWWLGVGGLGAGLAACVAALAGRWLIPGRPKAGRGALTAQESARELVQVVLDAAPDAVLFFSDAGVIRYSNAAARELFFDGERPEGANFLTLVARAPAPLREALLGETDQLFSVEVDGHHETYHVSRRSFPLGGEVHTLLLVKHLTREIARREVDVLKQVVRVISHEVNNSLAPVSSLVHSARVIAKSPKGHEKLALVFDTIEERASHLSSFLEGYAAVARLPRPRPRLVEAAPFLHQLSLLHPEVQVHEPPAAPGWFDPAQLEQLVINLVKNAREAGSALADIEIVFKTEASGATDLEVLDRGPGFSGEALKNALLPLYTTKARGSGTGLALSREIAEAHGGSLVIANRADGGALVRVHLPGKAVPDSSLTRSRLTLSGHLTPARAP